LFSGGRRTKVEKICVVLLVNASWCVFVDELRGKYAALSTSKVPKSLGGGELLVGFIKLIQLTLCVLLTFLF
jgi:hypothetical protein